MVFHNILAHDNLLSRELAIVEFILGILCLGGQKGLFGRKNTQSC